MPRSPERVPGLILGGCLAALTLVSCATPDKQPGPVADERLSLKGPMLVAFIPPRSAPGSREDLEDALQRTAACLADGGVRARTQVVEKEWIKVKDDDREIPLYPPFTGATGVFLLLPARPARYVDTVAGTATLRTSLPDAAAQYFSVTGCTRNAS